MLAFLNADSWHIGKRRQGNTATILREKKQWANLLSVDRTLTGEYAYTSTGRFREISLFFSLTLRLQLISKTTRATQTNNVSSLKVQENAIQKLTSCYIPQKNRFEICGALWAHQFLQAFFFLLAPSPQVGAMRELGSGFLKSSSSRRASESTRSCRKTGNKEPHSTQHNRLRLHWRPNVTTTHQIIVIHVIGRQHPHVHRVGVQSRFLCWHDMLPGVSITQTRRYNSCYIMCLIFHYA